MLFGAVLLGTVLPGMPLRNDVFPPVELGAEDVMGLKTETFVGGTTEP